MNHSKILITGSCGFVFSNIVLYMLQNTKHDIVSVDKLTYAGSLNNISYNADIHNKRHKFYLADISDYDLMSKIFKMEKPDIVINGAAESNVDHSISDASGFVTSNVSGTHSLLEAARQSHMPDLFIQFSSDEVYGQIVEGNFKETDHLNPRNPYSATKASADLMCISYINTYQMPIIVTRTCNIFGPRQKDKFIPTCVLNVLNNKKIPVYGKGLQAREWIYTKDVFNALMVILEKGVKGEIYNIGTGYEFRNIDLAKNILRLMNKPEDFVEFTTDRQGHDFRYALDTSKIQKLGWRPAFGFEESLAHTISWYKKNTWFPAK